MRGRVCPISCAVFFAVGFLFRSSALAASPATIKIPYSTPVKLVLLEQLSSATNKIEDPVHLEVAEDVAVHGTVIVRRGAPAGGHVVDVERRGKLGRPGKLNIQVDWVEAVDGLSKGIRSDLPQWRGMRKKSMMPVPVRLIVHGKDVEMPQGTRFIAYMNGSDEVAVDDAARALKQLPAAQSAGEALEQLSMVKFTSTPDGAEITIDGKFVGTTPSSLRLAPGEHAVRMAKAGFKLWERSLTVFAGGEVSLSVSLEKLP